MRRIISIMVSALIFVLAAWSLLSLRAIWVYDHTNGAKAVVR